MGKASAARAAAKAVGQEPSVRLSKREIVATRELLEGVMTLASHGILYRVGQMLGESVVEEARAGGGALPDAAASVLAGRQFASDVRFFPHKVQVRGSIEVKTGPEMTCHLMRGILQRVLSAEGGAVMVREEECASQGASDCLFVVSRGGRAP